MEADFERMQREAVAASVRITAGAFRGLAATVEEHARELERHADSIEKGRGSLTPRRPSSVARADEERSAGLVAQIDGDRLQRLGIDELDVSDELKDWLRQFHERYRRSPHFADAVNSVAGMELSAETAESVAGIVRNREMGVADG